MQRRLVIIVAALLLIVPAALAWPGTPKAPAPTPPQPVAPPPAWIETQAKTAWLFYGSYCWKTVCLDLIPPETRPGLPVFAAARGALVRVNLRFAATAATISIDRHTVHGTLNPAKRILAWRASRAGILTIAAHAAAGTASYVARLQVR